MRRNYRHSQSKCSQWNNRWKLGHHCSSNKDNYWQSFSNRSPKSRFNRRSEENMVIVTNFIEIAVGTFSKN